MRREALERASDLYFLDARGCTPTWPMSDTWAQEGVRALVPSVAPQGRRVTVRGALAPYGPPPRRTDHSRSGKIDRAAFMACLGRAVAGLPDAPEHLPVAPHRPRPCVIVLDNYAVHRRAAVKEVRPALEAAGVTFFYLPPYAPELNALEALWRHIKHEDRPVRSYETADALKTAVDRVLDDHVAQIAQSTMSLRDAA